MSNPKVGFDPRVDAIEQHIARENAERTGRVVNEAHRIGYAKALQEVKSQQWLANTNAILDRTVNQTLDLMPMPVTAAGRAEVHKTFLTDLNARCQVDPEIRGLVERGEIEAATARVVSNALTTVIPDKIGAMVKLDELDKSTNNGDYTVFGRWSFVGRFPRCQRHRRDG